MNRQLISMLTLVIKEVKRVIRIWVQTLIPPAITMSLYFLIFGTLIGRRIGEMVPGIGYIEYIAPGLIMMSVITNSYGNVVSSFFNAKIQGHIQEMLVAPMNEVSIVLGFVAGGMVRGLFVALVVSLISLFFPALTVQHPFLTIVVIIMTAAVFSLAGLVNAIFARTFDEIAIIPSFVLAPLTYLGGVFYTISLLPEFWQVVSRFNPILYMVNSMRYSMLGVSDIDISKVVNFHKKHGKDATLSAVYAPGRFGVLDIQGSQILKFTEKPKGDGALINGGFFVLYPKVLARISGDDCTWENEPLKGLAMDGNLMAYTHEGFWQPMDTMREMVYLQELWDKNEAPWKSW